MLVCFLRRFHPSAVKRLGAFRIASAYSTATAPDVSAADESLEPPMELTTEEPSDVELPSEERITCKNSHYVF